MQLLQEVTPHSQQHPILLSVSNPLWHITTPNSLLVSFLFKDLDYTETGLFFLFTSKQFLTRNTHQDHQYKPGFLPINQNEKKESQKLQRKTSALLISHLMNTC